MGHRPFSRGGRSLSGGRGISGGRSLSGGRGVGGNRRQTYYNNKENRDFSKNKRGRTHHIGAKSAGG